MRLLNTKSLDFEEFQVVGNGGSGNLSYAILSHTWGTEEVSFADHISRQNLSKGGYDKIRGCCKLAESEGFQYVWIDTCCIDKSSSAELSEAINSMFQWYRNAAVCYAYLSDVDSSEIPDKDASSFSRSRWFTRGWTLQELLAPTEVVFLGSDWTEIGTKRSLRATVSRITGISENVLQQGNWSGYSVAQKMSWGAGRQTTRPEDEAYCLMGLFDVNMPLLYGEGRKAFSRLQQEILRLSEDQSIFAWSYPKAAQSHLQISGLMAPSPEYFKDASRIGIMDFDEKHESLFEVVNQLVRMSLPVVPKVRALKLQMLSTNPLTYQIVEIQSDQDKGEFEMLTQTSSLSTPTTFQTPVKEMPSLQIPVSAPRITIDDEEGNSKTLVHPPEGETESAAIAETNSPAVKLSKHSNRVAGPSDWVRYIYETVVVVPLRCQVEGNQLGILLSQGSTEHIGLKVLSHLHTPSLVALNGVLASNLGQSVTRYVVISANPKPVRYNYPQAQPYRWPEIRIGNLISSDYSIDRDYMTGWEFQASRSALVPDPKFPVAITPFVLAYHTSGDDSAHPTFSMSILKYHVDELLCYVEVYSDDMARILEYDVYSFDLAVMRRAQVPLGNGSGVVTKYREAPHQEFVSLSIEPLVRNRSLVEKTIQSTTVEAWLKRTLR